MELPIRRYWDVMFQYLQPLRNKVIWLTLLIFSMLGLQLVNPQLIRYFIDTAVSTTTLTPLIYAALFYLGFSLLLQLIGVVTTYISEDIGWRSTNQLRADLARHCLHLDMSFHNEHTPGEMIERIDGDVAHIAIFFSQFVIRIMGNVLLIVGVLIVLLWEDWRISLALGVFTAVTLYTLSKLRQIAVPHWKAAREANADLFSFIEEQLSGTEDVRSSGAVPFVMKNLARLNRIRMNKEIDGAMRSILIIGTWIGLFGIGRIIALVSGYYLYQAGVLTIGSVYLVLNYTLAIFRPLREITNQIEQMQQAAAGIERVESLQKLISKITNTTTTSLPNGPLSVTFDHVTFAYHEEEHILKDIDFTLQPGEVLGLLGRTGSGKTTLTRLLFRLYDTQTGQIQLGNKADSIHIQDTPVMELRQRIGMVTQDVQLFRATVRDNLTFFDKSITDEQILAVIHDLGLTSWFESLTDGLDTELQTEGSSLSAGEAQLLAFTRVFLKDPGLVILDEASSRLDPATEQLIERAVDKLLANRTGIIVAHRLGTVARADKIMILGNGRILEHGPYNELVNNPTSHFSQLLQTGLEAVMA
ncbi:MAG: ABC transporter ATP-binding protein [Chloroflexi bacterium]|nr:MAG: ABC transporter ATP-binding protein [Chloroflexota bacterium]